MPEPHVGLDFAFYLYIESISGGSDLPINVHTS